MVRLARLAAFQRITRSSGCLRNFADTGVRIESGRAGARCVRDFGEFGLRT